MSDQNAGHDSSSHNEHDEAHNEIRSLLGVYAVDALEAQENTVVRGHLESCAECRDEMVALADAAAAVALTADVEPSPDLWDRLLAGMRADSVGSVGSVGSGSVGSVVSHGLGETGVADANSQSWSPKLHLNEPVSPVSLPAMATRSTVVELATHRVTVRRRSLRMALAGAAAAAALAVPATLVLTGGPAPTIAAMAERAEKAPGSQLGSLVLAENKQTVGQIVLTANGEGYVKSSTLAPLPAEQTYQLWAIVDGKPVSAGLLGNDPGDSAFTVKGDVAAMALSIEPKGGVAQPSTPIALAEFA